MNFTKKEILFSILITTSITSTFSQELTKKEFVRSVQEADISFYYDEDFEKAAFLYESLLKTYPENHNLKAKLGICYLNIDGKKQEALKLLKTASEKIVSKEAEYTEYGDEAPLDVYLYLPIAYHMNDSLDKAVSLFSTAKRALSETDIFREEYLNNQIRDCRYAIEMKKKPLTIISDLFIPWLSEYPGSCNPVLSKNDSVFIFTQKREGKTSILCSYKKNSKWQRPSDITRQLGGSEKFYSNSITADGKLLVLFLDDGEDGNIYFSHRKDSTWSKIKNPGKTINSIYWESHGFITPDGKKLYFSSNRQGGFGELDIWVSDKKTDGTWDRAVNLGEVINTPFNEDTPYYDPVNNVLLFSSVGHISMGGYDVFRSEFRNGGWTNPVGIPFAYNTTAENTFFILNNNTPGFITSIYNEKNSTRNIYSLVAVDPPDEITNTEGAVSLKDGMEVDPKKTSMKLTFEGDFLAIKNILFPFDSYKLDNEAITLLEAIKSILVSNPGLKIEVAGYTDAKGSTDYNMKLAGKRAKAVTDYLVSAAIPSSRFVLKSFGESNFTAVNTNRNGSDNPEGRKYNRRVAFGIIDPKTGVILRQETYTPEHLRLVSSMRYSIILKQSAENLSPEFSDGLKLEGMLFVRTIKSDSLSIYAIGLFYNKTDAIKYLAYVKENGFTDACIVNQYDLNNASMKQAKLTPVVSQANGKKIYTVQVKAARSPVNMNQFSKFPEVREILSEDGYYRYVTGEYTQFTKAKEALQSYRDAGFSDAFIREINLLITK